MTKLDLRHLFVSPGVRFRIFSSTKEISPAEWNRIAQDYAAMMEWEYFYILEQSGCISEHRRFNPFYVGMLDRKDRLIGLAPLFERKDATHEFGISGLISEVAKTARVPFDRGLVGTIPFTPVPAYNFLREKTMNRERFLALMLKYIDYICEICDFLSVRFYFVDPDLGDAYDIFSSYGYVQLMTNHFLWTNSYDTFDDYLRSLGSHRRRNIKRELRKIAESGVKVQMVKGADAAPELYDKMYGLYLRTWNKHMPPNIKPFLNRQFFSLLRPFFKNRCLFSIAAREEECLGMAIFFEKKGRMFGRYWGAYEEVPFLHFTTCYYVPMMYAIEKNIRYFDPGFGGYHKQLRGFKTVRCYHYVKFFGPNRRLGYVALENVLNQWGTW